MFINLIVANSTNNVIGKDGTVPWHFPQDLKRFRELTIDSIVIMGRKTFESIGKPLDERYNFIISKSNLSISGIYSFMDIDSALDFAKNTMPERKIFVIGGANIYKQFLEKNLINRIYQTVINKRIDGDTFFDFDKSNWFILDKKENSEFSYIVWEKEIVWEPQLKINY